LISHGVVLFQRTTRSVALTGAGAALLARLQPAVAEMTGALAALGGYQTHPSGTLRLTISRTAAHLLAERVLPEHQRLYPGVRLELSVDEGTVDLASGQYDAGIRQGESVEKDMVAIRLTPPVRWAVYGSPEYFVRRERPTRPENLTRHGEALRHCYRYTNVKAVAQRDDDASSFAVIPCGHGTRLRLHTSLHAFLGLFDISIRQGHGSSPTHCKAIPTADRVSPSGGAIPFSPSRRTLAT
jgi:DNA-binding transcriptional LysR family regulator